MGRWEEVFLHIAVVSGDLRLSIDGSASPGLGVFCSHGVFIK